MSRRCTTHSAGWEEERGGVDGGNYRSMWPFTVAVAVFSFVSRGRLTSGAAAW